MLQTILSVAAVIMPFAIAVAAWMRSVDHRLDKLEQGQVGMSLQLSALAREGRRRAGEEEQ